MKLWLLLIFTFMIQEDATLTSTLYLALQHHFSAWLIHLAFVSATCFDIWLGYRLGSYIDQKFLHNSRFQKWVRRHAGWINKPGRNYILVFTGIIDFPFLNGVIGSWVELPFKLIFITTLIGNLISYAFIWAVTQGIITLKINHYISVGIIVAIVVVVAYFLNKYFNEATE